MSGQVLAITVYADSQNTARIYALSASVHQLPRHIRKTAFAGCIEFDAKACQVAIVAHLWDLPCLTRFLCEGKSFWSELIAWLQLDEGYKDTLKQAVYSIIFGRTKKNVE